MLFSKSSLVYKSCGSSLTLISSTLNASILHKNHQTILFFVCTSSGISRGWIQGCFEISQSTLLTTSHNHTYTYLLEWVPVQRTSDETVYVTIEHLFLSRNGIESFHWERTSIFFSYTAALHCHYGATQAAKRPMLACYNTDNSIFTIYKPWMGILVHVHSNGKSAFLHWPL